MLNGRYNLNQSAKTILMGTNAIGIVTTSSDRYRQKKNNTRHTKSNTGNNDRIILLVKKKNTTRNNKKSNFRSKNKLKEYLYTNIKGKGLEYFLTLTYANPVTEPEQLYKDFQKFIRQLRRVIKKEYRANVEYIAVLDRQKGGNWHFHVALIANRKLDNINNIKDIVKNNWDDKGIIQIQRIRKRYKKLINYLAKKINKANLEKTPSYINMYRISRGIKKPTVIIETLEAAEARVKGYILVEEHEYAVEIYEGYTIYIWRRLYVKLRI